MVTGCCLPQKQAIHFCTSVNGQREYPLRGGGLIQSIISGASTKASLMNCIFTLALATGNMKMDRLIKGNGRGIRDMDMERIHGQMGTAIKESGKIITDMDKEYINGQVGTPMKGSGRMIIGMEQEDSPIQVANMKKVNGRVAIKLMSTRSTQRKRLSLKLLHMKKARL
ncbi:hypothetical protein FGO68_gene8483 [Halteria grandinella]|uniref:Uncharacterized protein n=1 Tax=Halteria grandinella TaxID=5974 RepID=A0A8J8T5N9_HALGN|nr:hypothetical protein FGO68_gene8483 [Halteria grandinella]